MNYIFPVSLKIFNAFCLSIFIFGVSHQLPAQSDVPGWHHFTNLPFGHPKSMSTSDQHLIHCQITNNIEDSSKTMLVFKTDTAGTLIWKKCVLFPYSQDSSRFLIGGLSMVENKNGRIGILSTSDRPTNSGLVALFILNGQTGNLIIRRDFNFGSIDPQTITTDSQGNFVLCAQKGGDGFGTWILNLDNDGQIINGKIITGSTFEYSGGYVTPTATGWTLLRGQSPTVPGTYGYKSLILSRLNKQFGHIRTSRISIPSNLLNHNVYPLSPNRILISAFETNYTTPLKTFYVCLDSNLNRVWAGYLYFSGDTSNIGIQQYNLPSHTKIQNGVLLSTNAWFDYELDGQGNVIYQRKQGFGAYLYNNFGYVGDPYLSLFGEPFLKFFNSGNPDIYQPSLRMCRNRKSDPSRECDLTNQTSIGISPMNVQVEPFTDVIEKEIIPIEKYVYTQFNYIQANVCTYKGFCPSPFSRKRDITVCTLPYSLNLPVLWPDESIRWEDGTMGYNKTVISTGFYKFKVTTPCFGIMDSIRIVLKPVNPQRAFGLDTFKVCSGAKFPVSGPVVTHQYRWADDREQQIQTGNSALFQFDTSSFEKAVIYRKMKCRVTIEPGCWYDTSAVVEITPTFPDQLPDSIAVCKPDTILTGSFYYPTAINWVWTDPQDILHLQVVRAKKIGNYSLRIQRGQCSQNDNTYLFRPVFAGGIVGTFENQVLVSGQVNEIERPGNLELGLIDANANNIVWTSGNTTLSKTEDLTIPIRQDTSVSITVSYEIDGCFREAKFETSFLFKEPIFPNLITWNGDNLNDEFRSFPSQAKGSLDIHNRWGKKIFSSSDYSGTWPDGNTQSGTYFFRFVFSKSKKIANGYVTVAK